MSMASIAEQQKLDAMARAQRETPRDAAFEDGLKGSVEAGNLADLVVLAEDVSGVPADRLRHVGVAMTVLGGDVVYSAR